MLFALCVVFRVFGVCDVLIVVRFVCTLLRVMYCVCVCVWYAVYTMFYALCVVCCAWYAVCSLLRVTCAV